MREMPKEIFISQYNGAWCDIDYSNAEIQYTKYIRFDEHEKIVNREKELTESYLLTTNVNKDEVRKLNHLLEHSRNEIAKLRDDFSTMKSKWIDSLGDIDDLKNQAHDTCEELIDIIDDKDSEIFKLKEQLGNTIKMYKELSDAVNKTIDNVYKANGMTIPKIPELKQQI
jgi:methyl-accepting chemotaxis protein